ncbi:RNA polymerase Rpc34 [Neoconidiobolus thromboides FSU 785]|nr:RNA polymerase Rpc34 [Neoconidiobolus thromboides FSU 785]
MNGIEPNLIVNAVNNLSSFGLLDFFMVDGQMAFNGVPITSLEKLDELNEEEKRIYKTVEDSQNEGIWIKTLKSKTGLHQNVVTRCIKVLENKNLIKAVKSINNPTRKVYMLWDKNPSIEMTGGPWYTDQNLDEQFVQLLYEHIFKFITHLSFPRQIPEASGLGACFDSGYTMYPTATNIYNYIATSQISRQKLTLDDIREILNLLVFDGKIIKFMSDFVPRPGFINQYQGQQNNHNKNKDEDEDKEEFQTEFNNDAYDWQYKAVFSGVFEKDRNNTNALTDIPCGTCPVYNQCHPNGQINPNTCEYLKDWLDF